MRLTIIIVFSLFLFSGCEFFQSQDKHLHHSQHLAFGTVIEITFWGEDESRIASAEKLIKEDFDYMHFAWHPYEAGPLARINTLLPMGANFSVAPSVLPLISRGKELETLSDGYFNPAIGGLIQLWGFDREESIKRNEPPAKQELENYMADVPSMADVEIDNLQIKGKNKKLFLDFGGFAKGYGVDKVANELVKKGYRNFILNAGGDLRAVGSKGGKPWTIGIRHPRNNGVLASLEIQGDESVFTSGDYERYFEYQGKRYHHILSPKTGYPATDFQSVTIVNNDAALADAAATAIFVAGLENWQRVATQMGLTKVMLVDQTGKVILTTQLKERIKLRDVAAENITTVDMP